MARKIFFSFHYERDAWRAGQVRNCNLLPCEDQYGFMDAADWQSIKSQGNEAIKRWINEQLGNTTVTAVLIGTETSDRDWVLHEILKSWNRGNGILGIWIHLIKNQNSQTDTKGSNPLDHFKLPDGTLLSSVCKTYDWVADDGRNNLGKWAEEACKIRAKYGEDEELVQIRSLQKAYAAPAYAASSTAFTPRAPWGANDVVKR